MKLPTWLRTKSTRRSAERTITVDLEIDTAQFEDAMYDVVEGFSRAQHERRLRHERSLGQAYVGVLLDDWCRSEGWDPVQVWRIPREQDLRDARALAELQLMRRLNALVGPQIDARYFRLIGSVTS